MERLLKSIFIFTLFFSNLTYADETLDQLREAYKLIKQARKEQKKQEAVEQANDIDMVVCIQCPQISNLAGEINKAMRNMVETGQIDLKERGALEEIEKLEAMYYIVENDLEAQNLIESDTPQEPCSFYQLDVYLKDFTRQPLQSGDLTEIFSFEIPFQNINSIHYRPIDEKGRYYFYQAAPPDNDKIIVVHMKRDGKPTVTYFQKGTMPKPSDSDYMRKYHRQKIEAQIAADLSEEEGNTKTVDRIEGKEYWGGLNQYESETSKWTYGFAIAHKDNLPRKLILLKGEDRTEITEGLNVKTNVEVSDRDQEVSVALAGDQQDYLRLTAEANGDYRASVPFAVKVDAFDIGANGEISQNQDGNEARVSFFSEGDNLINLRAHRGNNGVDTYNVGNTYQDVLGGSLSVEYQQKRGPELSEKGVWFRFSRSF